MSYVDYCRKHGDFKGDYCGECFEELQVENARFRKALEWYGRGGFEAGCTPTGENDGLSSAYWQDQGKRARAALEGK
jgi:hypothetical protein